MTQHNFQVNDNKMYIVHPVPVMMGSAHGQESLHSDSDDEKDAAA